MREALSADYDHVLATCLKYVRVHSWPRHGRHVARAAIDAAFGSPLRRERVGKSRFDSMPCQPASKPLGRYPAYEVPLDDWEANDGLRVSDLGPLVGCWFTRDPEQAAA